QRVYVQNGWNLPGDSYIQDADGYFWYQARTDDMIISGGHNISGPEIEAVLLDHPAVAECGVVGAPDEIRGNIVKAYVVLRADFTPGPELVKELQDFVKAEIAPYKYPRAIEFLDSLPRTETGKLQRFRLRERAGCATSSCRKVGPSPSATPTASPPTAGWSSSPARSAGTRRPASSRPTTSPRRPSSPCATSPPCCARRAPAPSTSRG